MPSTYAHYRMGKELIKALPESRQTIIRNNMELYLIGLHGPDILFYYKPLKQIYNYTFGSEPGEACTDAPAGKKEGYKDAV